MAKFKPEVTFRTEDSEHKYRNSYSKSRYVTLQFPTYRELKKEIKNILIESLDDTVHVSRSRRGTWGEWFEHWKLINGKPTIIKQGWM